MKTPVRRNCWFVYVLCGCFGLLGWTFYLIAFNLEPSQDWMVFYTAARADWEDNLPLIFEGDRFTAVGSTIAFDMVYPTLPLIRAYPPISWLSASSGLNPAALPCALFLLTGLIFVLVAPWTSLAASTERILGLAGFVLQRRSQCLVRTPF